MNILKALLALVLIIPVILFAMGVGGHLFYVWPTDLDDKDLIVTDAMLAKLDTVKHEKKFVQDLSIPYPGAPNEGIRLSAEYTINEMISDISRSIQTRPKKSTVLRSFKKYLVVLKESDSEERDRALVYVEQIMDICQIDNSNELLNVWRYGIPYGFFGFD